MGDPPHEGPRSTPFALGLNSFASGAPSRDEARLDSGIDLLVEFSSPIGLFEFMQLTKYLEDILGVQVDLVTEPALKKQVKAQILKELIRAA